MDIDFKKLIDANGHAEIPEGTDKIPQRAFKACDTLRSVSIPDSVKVIQQNAFGECKSLTSITLPDSVKKISRDCFADCTRLTSAVLPKGITTVEDGLFRGCTSLKEIVIPEGVTHIGKNAFCGCKSLTRVVLPDSLTLLGEASQSTSGWEGGGPFERCESLVSIAFPKRLETIGYCCFKKCSQLAAVVLPDSLKEISSFAFEQCALESAVLPDSLETIGYDAFSHCPLKTIHIPSKIKTVNGFNHCVSLESVFLPDGLEAIGSHCFSDCESLAEVKLPDHLSRIESSAFSGCTSLKTPVIPDTVTEIQRCAFSDCSSITSMTIPSGVKKLTDDLFNGCSSLETVNLPEKLEEIGNNVFDSCLALKEAVIPEGVSKIPGHAFAGCKSVHIHLPSTVEVFETGWGSKYNEAADITVSPDNKALAVEEHCLVDLKERTLLLVLPDATAFPQNLRSIKLAREAFPGLYDVDELVIPEGVSYIERLPFKKMTRLKKLRLPASMKDVGPCFMDEYPMPSVAVSPDLFLSGNFKAWGDICKVELIGIDAVSPEFLEKIKEKYKNQKEGWRDRYSYSAEGAGRLFWVYLNGQLVYPAAHIVRKKEEAMAAQRKKEEEERLDSKKKEMTEKMEDVTIASLCAATFGNNGFEFVYREDWNKVKVIIRDEISIARKLNLSSVQEDLAFLLEVATTYRNALKPYVEQFPDAYAASQFRSEKVTYCVCGNTFPKHDVYLTVQDDTLSVAFQAVKDLAASTQALKQKYGEKFEELQFNVWW